MQGFGGLHVASLHPLSAFLVIDGRRMAAEN
jgi:hypothetical protein